jgi:hypothetical protein
VRRHVRKIALHGGDRPCATMNYEQGTRQDSQKIDEGQGGRQNGA